MPLGFPNCYLYLNFIVKQHTYNNYKMHFTFNFIDSPIQIMILSNILCGKKNLVNTLSSQPSYFWFKIFNNPLN